MFIKLDLYFVSKIKTLLVFLKETWVGNMKNSNFLSPSVLSLYYNNDEAYSQMGYHYRSHQNLIHSFSFHYGYIGYTVVVQMFCQ